MYAYKQPQPASPPSRRPRRASSSHSRKRQTPYRELALETTVKLGVNVVLSLVAIVAIAKLLPYRASQEARMQELNVALRTAETRFDRVQTNFGQYFDPTQARFIMQQQTNRIDPSQRQVIWQQTPRVEPPQPQRQR